jgi:hypothetical protein
VELIVRGWRQVDRKAEALQTIRRHESRWLQAYPDADGMVVIRGRLEPKVGAVVLKALAAARDILYRATDASAETRTDEVPPTWEQLHADALALIAETVLNHGIEPGTPAERDQVVVHVDAAVLANAEAPGRSVVEDGTHVAAETAQRLACDATRVIMRRDSDSRITEVSARKRTISPALRRALDGRDRGCRFPGCGRRFTQGHHIRHWAQGGPTTLSNLALLCPRHHRAVHEEGFAVERRPNGELTFDGRTGASWQKCLRPHCRPRPPSMHCELSMKRTGFIWTRTRRCRGGSATGLTSAMRSTSYIRSRTLVIDDPRLTAPKPTC